MINAENIVYSIGGQRILANVYATFTPGKVTAILGPNGAGKSTLLKCLTGALKPDEGKVSLEGKDLRDYSLTELSRRRAVLSQANPISFPFTAHEIVVMGRNPYSLEKTTASNAEIADEALTLVDAWHLRDRSYPTLSGGEQQRIQFARVLAQIWEQEGACLFLDEPTSALDLKHQHQLMDLVQKLCAEKNLTVIIVMHDLTLAYHCTDRCFFIREGWIRGGGESKKLITADTISEIFDLPMEYAAMRFGMELTG
ncbi:heme ABC transporter ATP-binding protein [Sneathiella sp.]|uniref:heme ABC transporter ATP-binding protein n=1 Tax=Sneathiella sp. TaxID=1964365 RepID=UPI002631380F|nr:heme ABC transporter ATP-binding protein [Sneathiella sp.]MDF2366694.1 heme ABC transporter ATP-binding protein [Sneathiella sp.]